MSGCSDEEEAAVVSTAPRLTVAAAGLDAAVPGTVFEKFTDATSIEVVLRDVPLSESLGNASSLATEPPADLLLTSSVATIWRASDEGGLRRLGEESGIEGLPDMFVDPDRHWIALGISFLEIVTSDQAVDRSVLEYADLSDERFRGQLCLTSSALPENRLLIALYIDERGQRPAEILVRGWLANLARPPLQTPQDVLDAIAAGACGYAIVPARSLGDLSAARVPGMQYRGERAIVAHAIGIARHARQPGAAARLLAWLADPEGQAVFAAATGTVSTYDFPVPAAPNSVARYAPLDEDARLLAERAGWD